MTVTRRKVFEDAAASFAGCPSLDNYARMRRALELYAQSDAAVEHAQCTASACSFANKLQSTPANHVIHVKGEGPFEVQCPRCKGHQWFVLPSRGKVRCPQCGDVTTLAPIAEFRVDPNYGGKFYGLKEDLGRRMKLPVEPRRVHAPTGLYVLGEVFARGSLNPTLVMTDDMRQPDVTPEFIAEYGKALLTALDAIPKEEREHFYVHVFHSAAAQPPEVRRMAFAPGSLLERT